MNSYAKLLSRDYEFGLSLDKRYAILCQMIAKNGTHEDLIALTNEYQNLKGSAPIATVKTENIGA